MTAPLSSILCGMFGSRSTFHATNLDVVTSIITTPSITVDVTANDDIPGTISAPVITSGPAGASATVVGNQIQFNHNGAGVYVIAYTSTVGILTDTGFLTVTIQAAPTGGTPPAAAASTQFANTSNLASFSMPVTTPPNARGVFFTLVTWMGFSAPEPQTVTITADYAGTAMTRVDTFGNSISIGDPNAPSDPGPACYSFLLLTPGDTLPASGNITWNVTVSGGGDPEIHAAYAMFPTHPSRDLIFSELGSQRGSGPASSVTVNATAAASSLLVNVSGWKGNYTVGGDNGWTPSQIVNADGSSNLVSGRLIAETQSVIAAGAANHVSTSSTADLHSSATYQFADPLGPGTGGLAPIGETLTALASSGGGQITVDMSGAGGSPAGAITAVNVVNGEGVATFSGQDLLFDPPDEDGATVVEVAYANTQGNVISTVTITTALTLRLDTITGPVSTPTLTADVTANDTSVGTITSPVISSGPAGASVAVVGNQIQLTHNGAGIYVIDYTSVIGGNNNQGTLTAVVTAATGTASPPAVAPITYQSSTGNNVPGSTLVVPPGTPLPANTRAVILALGSWMGFGASEPQTINSLTADYEGNAMTRIDTFGNSIFIGDDGAGPTGGTPPAAYVFALLSSGGAIPTSGTVSWNLTLSDSDPELHMAQLIAITHPDRDLTVAELANFRADGNITATTVNANASANSVALNFSTMKRQVTATGQAGWTQEELVVLDHPSQDIQSGRLLGESLVVNAAGPVNHTTTTSAANLTGSVTIEVTDTGGSGTPPTAQSLTATALTGGAQISVDMSSAGGSPAGVVTAVNILTGGGVATFSGQNLLFTPPSADGVTQVEVTYANAAGAVVSTVDITSSTAVAALGPRVGFGVNIGQTNTSLAAINTEVQSALGSFEAELRALHDARANNNTDASIQARPENAGFVTLTGKSLTDLNNALNAGNRKLFLTAAGGDYNWSGTKPNFDNIELVGLVDAGMPAVVVGGTPQNRGQLQFRIRGQGGRLEGIEFKDSALCFSFVGASGIIPRMHVDFCKFTNVANSIHMEFGGSFGNVNANTGCQSIRWNNCIAENVSHGLNMRCGPGYGETGSPPASNDFQVGSFEAIESIVKDHDNMGICCHYDTRGGTSSSVFWPGIGSGSVGTVRRCIVDRRTISNLNGFPCNLTACEESRMQQSFFTNTLANPLGRDDDVYTKSRIGEITDCVVWNTGTSTNFQGQLGCKGEGNPGSLKLGLYNIQNNFVGHDNSKDISRNVFVQRSNVRIDSNVIIVATGSNNEGGGITQQGGGSGYSNFASLNNLYRCFGGFNQSVAAQLSSNIQNWSFTDDTIETFRSGAHTLIQLRNGGGHSHLDTVIRRVRFIKRSGAGTVTAITIQQSGSTLRNPTIDDCDFDNINTALAISGGTVTGAVTFTDNQHTGSTPSTSNSTGSTVNTFGGGGGNSF